MRSMAAVTCYPEYAGNDKMLLLNLHMDAEKNVICVCFHHLRFMTEMFEVLSCIVQMRSSSSVSAVPNKPNI